MNGIDYMFMNILGFLIISYGEVIDCNGESFLNFCLYFGNVIIDIRGIGFIIYFMVCFYL